MIVAYNALHLRPRAVGGGTTFTLNVLARLPEALPSASFLVYCREGEDRIVPDERLRLRRLRVGGIVRRVAAEMLWLGRDLRRERADVLLSPNESVPARPPCPLVLVAQNLVYHQDPPPEFDGERLADRLLTRAQFAYYRRRMSGAYQAAAVVAAVSETTRNVLAARAGLDPRKTRVVLEGSDSLLMPPAAERPRALRLLSVSTLAPYKGLDRALELLARLRSGHPELALDVVGGDWRGYGRVLERKARELGVPDAVRWLGDVPAQRLADLYAASLALLHLSSCEAFGLPAVEAMRYGLPVVAADRSSLPEVAAGAALLVDPDDVPRAAERVSALLVSEAERAELARRGRERAAELTWARTAAGLGELLRGAVRD